MNHLWKKLGLIYNPLLNAKPHPKLISHASNPVPIHIEGNVYRIFFSGRDIHNRSSVGAIDVDIIQRKIVQEFDQPFFEHGPPGSFYEAGVSIGNCYKADGKTFLLFMGWQTPENAHWRGDIGQLFVHDDLTLSMATEQALMGVDTTDLISLSYPWVLKDNANNYTMWYGSTLTWDAGNHEMIHIINHASSTDGHQWKREGLAIPYEIGYAQAFSRPSVVKINNKLAMWFSFRSGTGQKYKIGYASQDQNGAWILELDKAGIDISSSGWDSEMIEYPFVFEHGCQWYMLYNGNGHGKSGFGLAVLEQC